MFKKVKRRGEGVGVEREEKIFRDRRCVEGAYVLKGMGVI